MLTSVVAWVGLIPVGILSICIALCCVVYYTNRYVVTDIFSISLLLILLGDCVIVIPIECIVRANSFQPTASLCKALLWCFVTFRVVPVMYVLWMLFDRLTVLKPFVSVLHKQSVLFGTKRSALVWVVLLFLVGGVVGAVPLMYIDSGAYTLGDSCNVALYSVDWHFATFMTLFEMTGFTISFTVLIKLFIKTIHAQQRAGRRGWRKQNFVETINMRSIEDPTSYMENCKLVACVILSLYLLNHVPHGILNMLGLLSGGDVGYDNIVVIWLLMVDVIVVPIALWVSNKRYRDSIGKITSSCRRQEPSVNDENVFSTNIHFDPHVTVISTGDGHHDPGGDGGMSNPQFDQSEEFEETTGMFQNNHSSNHAGNSHFSQSQNGAYNNPAYNDAALNESTHFEISNIENNAPNATNTVPCNSYSQGCVNVAFEEFDNIGDTAVKQGDGERVSRESSNANNHNVHVEVHENSDIISSPTDNAGIIIDLPTDFTIDPGVTYKSSDYHHDYLSDDISFSGSEQFSIANLNEIDPVKPSRKRKRRRRRVVEKTKPPEDFTEGVTLNPGTVDNFTKEVTSNPGIVESQETNDVTPAHSEANDSGLYESIDSDKTLENGRDVVQLSEINTFALFSDIDDYIDLCKNDIEHSQLQDTDFRNFEQDAMTDNSIDIPQEIITKCKPPDYTEKNNFQTDSLFASVTDRNGYNNYIQEHILHPKENWHNSALILSTVDYFNKLKHEHLAILDNGNVFVASESKKKKVPTATLR